MGAKRGIKLKIKAYALKVFLAASILWGAATAVFAEPAQTAPVDPEQRASILGNNPFSLKVEQVFTGPEDMEPPTFTYRLRPLETGAPMPDGSAHDGYEFQITGNDSLYIGQFSYKKQGAYSYDLSKMIETDKPDYIDKKRKYKIEVYVDEELMTGVAVMNEDGTKAETIMFETVYRVPPGPNIPDRPSTPPPYYPGGGLNPLKTGDDMNLALFMALIIVSGVSAIRLLVYPRKRRDIIDEDKRES